jgi:hypothetical protein
MHQRQVMVYGKVADLLAQIQPVAHGRMEVEAEPDS